MVSLPKSIKVGPFTFGLFGDAKNFKRISDPYEIEEIEAYIKGLTDNCTCEIAINPSLGVANRAETVLHEALHAAWYAAQLGQSSEFGQFEEEIVTRLSPIILMLLRDNPQLVAYWTYSAPKRPVAKRVASRTTNPRKK